MFAYCLNNPVNYKDPNGQEPIMVTVAVTGVIILAGVVIASYYATEAIWAIGGWITNLIQTTWAEISYVKENAEPEIPDVTYPGDDPEKAPEGYEWKGKGQQGSKKGSYHKKETGESLHPDLDHAGDIDPHWDYNFRGSGVKGWRVFKNGRVELKK